MSRAVAWVSVLSLVGLVGAGCAGPPVAEAPGLQQLVGEATPAEGLVITNARILDGTGDTGVIENGSVVVRDGRIVSVSAGATEVDGALTIDAHGMTVMPGFVDAHRHIIQGDPSAWLEDQAADRMQEFLDAGFTSVFSAIDPTEAIVELRRRIADGELAGPRLRVGGFVPVAQAAGGPPTGVDPARTDVSRPPLRPTTAAGAIPEEVTRAQVQALAKAGVDAIKTVVTVTPGGPEKNTLRIIKEEGAKLGLPLVTHAVSVEDTLGVVEVGPDVLMHTPHIGQLDEAAVRTIVDAGIPMVSTLGVFVPTFAPENLRIRERSGDDNVPRFRDLDPFPMDTLSSAGQGPVNARLLWDAGIVYGYGTDTTFLPRDSLAHELRPLRLVFSARDIVQILTRNAALAMGLGDETGTLEAGKAADIVLIDGDPLADINDVLNVALVIKEGTVVVDRR